MSEESWPGGGWKEKSGDFRWSTAADAKRGRLRGTHSPEGESPEPGSPSEADSCEGQVYRRRVNLL